MSGPGNSRRRRWAVLGDTRNLEELEIWELEICASGVGWPEPWSLRFRRERGRQTSCLQDSRRRSMNERRMKEEGARLQKCADLWVRNLDDLVFHGEVAEVVAATARFELRRSAWPGMAWAQSGWYAVRRQKGSPLIPNFRLAGSAVEILPRRSLVL